MKKVLQVCCERYEIEDRLAEYLPGIDFRLEGGNLEYTITFLDVTEKESEDIDSLFEEEAYNNDEMKLAEMLVALAEECGVWISTAESCTGGMIASSIVDIPGCSKVYAEGLITYSNEAKIDRLGVSPATLKEFGAVSEDTAIEMANGLLSRGVDLGISTTGIAGPGGGSKEKPVGLVYIAVVSERHTDVRGTVLKGDRASIRRQSANLALFMAIQHLKSYF